MNEEGHTESTRKYNLAKGEEIKYQRFVLGHGKEERMCTLLVLVQDWAQTKALFGCAGPILDRSSMKWTDL